MSSSKTQMTETRKQLLLTLQKGGRSKGLLQPRPQMLEGLSNGSGQRRRVPVKGEICPTAIAASERPVASLRKKMGGLDTVAEVPSENSPPPTSTTFEPCMVPSVTPATFSRDLFQSVRFLNFAFKNAPTYFQIKIQQ